MNNLKCACGGTYTAIPDEDCDSLPPSFTAKRFHCKQCSAYDWLEPDEVGLDSWDDMTAA